MDGRFLKQLFIFIIFLVLIGGIFLLSFKSIIFKKKVEIENVFSPQVVESGYLVGEKDSVNLYAKIRNSNLEWSFKRIGYVFNIYSGNNQLLKSVSGETFVSAQQIKFIIEPAAQISGIPSKITFELVEPVDFERSLTSASPVQIINKNVTSENGQVIINGDVKNNTIRAISKVEMVGVGYKGGAIEAVSKTTVSSLNSGEQDSFRMVFPDASEILNFEVEAYGY